MNQILRKRKKGKNLLIWMMVLVMMLGMVQTAWADDYDADRSGSITIQLEDLGSNRENVDLRLYQVATVDTSENYLKYELNPLLASSGVDVNSLTTAEKSIAASEALAAAIATSTISYTNQVTDGSGAAKFENLSQGMYLLMQPGISEYGIIAPTLIAVPYMEDGENWIYDVEAAPKAAAHEQNGRIDVTKNLYYINRDLEWAPFIRRDPSTFYVGLFYDQAGTIPVGSDYVKEIRLEGTATNTVSYTNLAPRTYYVYELNAQREIITPNILQKDADGEDYRCFFGRGEDTDTNEVTLSPVSGMEGNAVVSNVYLRYPDEEYLIGELTIEKIVKKNGTVTTVGDTFYASVFTTDEDGDETLLATLELKQNDTVILEVPLGGETGREDTTCSVLETDKDGKPVDKKTFAYKVTGEGSVTFTENSLAQSIAITNEATSTTPTPTPTVTPTVPPTVTPTRTPSITIRPSNSSSTSISSTVKTEDSTPIAPWLGILGGAAMLILIGVVVKKMRKRP